MSDLTFPTLPSEQSASIDFHFEDVDAPDFAMEALATWIKEMITSHDGELVHLQYIFCSDNYLHRLNVEYLDHDTLTDIITFPYAPPPQIHGDLYISLERVADNARERDISFYDECCRVMIHGVLHLCGYEDKTPEEALKMRALEEEALGKR